MYFSFATKAAGSNSAAFFCLRYGCSSERLAVAFVGLNGKPLGSPLRALVMSVVGGDQNAPQGRRAASVGVWRVSGEMWSRVASDVVAVVGGRDANPLRDFSKPWWANWTNWTNWTGSGEKPLKSVLYKKENTFHSLAVIIPRAETCPVRPVR